MQQSFPAEIREYMGRFRSAYLHKGRPAAETTGGLVPRLRLLQKQVAYRNRVHFSYSNMEGGQSERIIDPYLLHCHDGVFYLIGPATTGRNRASSASPASRSSPPWKRSSPCGFDPAALLRSSLGIHLGDPMRVVLLFEGVAARYISRTPLHADQRILEESDDRLLIELPARGVKEVSELVLRYGPEAELIAPDELRRHVHDRLHAALRRYSVDHQMGSTACP